MQDMIFEEVRALCAAAKAAAAGFGHTSTTDKNKLLVHIAARLTQDTPALLEANQKDLAAGEVAGLSRAMLDRLALTEARLEGICEALRALVGLPDPVGAGECIRRPNGLEIRHVRAPMGVVAMIYEARPNVTVDAAALCLKTGNAVVLRGGKEAIHTNRALVDSIRSVLAEDGFSPDLVGLVASTDRDSSVALMNMRGLVDVLIPRGGKGLIRSVVEHARVPVIETGAGNCHLYVDDSADLDMAVEVALNAKCSRPSVCNAIETVLVHKDVADDFLPAFKTAVADAGYGVEIRGCSRTCHILPDATAAAEEDWDTEYNDYILSVKVVDSMEEAIAHIARFTTGHSEAIMTRSLENANRFQSEVDAAAVYVNASTRFTDGGEFGLGAEIGISTQKLHARGPMGLSALTTDKFLINGNGQVR